MPSEQFECLMLWNECWIRLHHMQHSFLSNKHSNLSLGRSQYSHNVTFIVSLVVHHDL